MWSESLQIVQRGAAAVLVLGLLFLLLWALRKKGVAQFSLQKPFGGGTRRLSVVERLALTPQHSLFLVQTNDQLLLLGASPAGLNRIDTSGLTGTAGLKGPATTLSWPESQARPER